ncbi:unnamed protein product, partial [Amoebophrya sp. A25]
CEFLKDDGERFLAVFLRLLRALEGHCVASDRSALDRVDESIHSGVKKGRSTTEETSSNRNIKVLFHKRNVLEILCEHSQRVCDDVECLDPSGWRRVECLGSLAALIELRLGRGTSGMDSTTGALEGDKKTEDFSTKSTPTAEADNTAAALVRSLVLLRRSFAADDGDKGYYSSRVQEASRSCIYSALRELMFHRGLTEVSAAMLQRVCVTVLEEKKLRDGRLSEKMKNNAGNTTIDNADCSTSSSSSRLSLPLALLLGRLLLAVSARISTSTRSRSVLDRGKE